MLKATNEKGCGKEKKERKIQYYSMQLQLR